MSRTRFLTGAAASVHAASGDPLPAVLNESVFHRGTGGVTVDGASESLAQAAVRVTHRLQEARLRPQETGLVFGFNGVLTAYQLNQKKPPRVTLATLAALRRA